jgi:hypothetical protein
MRQVAVFAPIRFQRVANWVQVLRARSDRIAVSFWLIASSGEIKTPPGYQEPLALNRAVCPC